MTETYDLEITCTCETEEQRRRVQQEITTYAKSKLDVKTFRDNSSEEVIELAWTGQIVLKSKERISYDRIKETLGNIATKYALCFELECTSGEFIIGTSFVGQNSNIYELNFLLSEVRPLIGRLQQYTDLLSQKLDTDERNVKKALGILMKELKRLPNEAEIEDNDEE